jgi:Undecaprenyl-phosphate glucose phosphotransferase
MNEIDPASRFSMEAVRRYEPAEDGRSAERPFLNAVAQGIASQYRQDTLSPKLVMGTFRMAEVLMLVVSGLVAHAWYFGSLPELEWAHIATMAAASLCAAVLLELGGAYNVGALLRPLSKLRTLAAAWCGTFALLALAGFFLKVSSEFSRLWIGAWFIGGFAMLVGLRMLVSRLIRRWARNGTMERRAVIVGGGKTAETLIRSLEKQPGNDIRICGIFDDRDNRRSPPIIAGYPKLGTISELTEFARIAQIDMMIVTLPLTAEARVLSLLKKLWVLPVDIRLSAHANQLQFRARSYSFIGAVPMLDIFDKPITDWDSVAKRLFDIVFSLIGIVVFAPVMLATALAIKLDSPGPVFFKQKRHGFNNEVIEVWKFRSMYSDQADFAAAKNVTRGDPRVTQVGRIIRKTSLDELPQFFNSLGGSLSLVGPRPHAVTGQTANKLFSEVVDGYFARHKVKPGVTGWAQINGWRGEVDNDEKIKKRTEYDLFYIENWSLWLDLKILLLTPIRILNTENAY